MQVAAANLKLFSAKISSYYRCLKWADFGWDNACVADEISYYLDRVASLAKRFRALTKLAFQLRASLPITTDCTVEVTKPD